MIKEPETNTVFAARIRRQLTEIRTNILIRYGEISTAILDEIREAATARLHSEGVHDDHTIYIRIHAEASALAKTTDPSFGLSHDAHTIFFIPLALLESDAQTNTAIYAETVELAQISLFSFYSNDNYKTASSYQAFKILADELSIRVNAIAESLPIDYKKLFAAPCKNYTNQDSNLYLVLDAVLDYLIPHFAIESHNSEFINPLKKTKSSWAEDMEKTQRAANHVKEQILESHQDRATTPNRAEFRAAFTDLYHWFDKNHEVGKFSRAIIQESFKTLGLGPVKESSRETSISIT